MHICIVNRFLRDAIECEADFWIEPQMGFEGAEDTGNAKKSFGFGGSILQGGQQTDGLNLHRIQSPRQTAGLADGIANQ